MGKGKPLGCIFGGVVSLILFVIPLILIIAVIAGIFGRFGSIQEQQRDFLQAIFDRSVMTSLS